MIEIIIATIIITINIFQITMIASKTTNIEMVLHLQLPLLFISYLLFTKLTGGRQGNNNHHTHFTGGETVIHTLGVDWSHHTMD